MITTRVKRLAVASFVAVQLGCLALCASREADEMNDLSLSQVKRYMASRDVAHRKRAMDELYKSDAPTVIDGTPDRELTNLLLKALSDRAAIVRLAACHTARSQIERISLCADAGKLEKAVRHLCGDRTETVDIDGDRTSVRIEALRTLRWIKYYRRPFPFYLAWEDQFFRPEIESMANSEDVVDLYGAASLSSALTGEKSLVAAVMILRRLLYANSEQVRRAALMSVLGLCQEPERPSEALIAASLLPDIREVAQHDLSANCRKIAEDCAKMLTSAIKMTEEALKVELKPAR